MTALRVAWLGPRLTYGGASFAAVQFLQGLAGHGDAVDCFFSRPVASAGQEYQVPGLTFFGQELQGWRPSGRGTGRFVFRQLQRVQREQHALELIADRHTRDPYDVLYVYSRAELLGIGRRFDRLPPVVLHPQTHAAGELRWHGYEHHLARRSESEVQFLATRAMLTARTIVQRRDLKRVAGVVAPSERFARYLVNDYGVDRGRIRVVWNPVDLGRFVPVGVTPPLPVHLGFVSRLAVRKGVEQVVALTHRLGDLAGRLRITVVGNRTPWSDYRSLLGDVNPDIATYPGNISGSAMAELYRTLHGLIVPSQYEPFGLTAAEALASGLPIVASDEVGATEDLRSPACVVYPAGDVDALEDAVRSLVASIEAGRSAELGVAARRGAEELYDPAVLSARLHDALIALAAGAGGDPVARAPGDPAGAATGGPASGTALTGPGRTAGE